MITAYDYPSASLLEQAGVDLVLVGDSLGMVVQGFENTLQVSLMDMIYHGKMVVKACPKTPVIIDMPHGSFHESVQATVANAKKLIEETGAQAVKMEGASPYVLEAIPHLLNLGISVCGHVGLEPQKVLEYGGFKKQGKTEESAHKILSDALKLEKAGVFALVLESIPFELAQNITKSTSVPTIGIGAGPFCDGQVQVWHDLMGLSLRPPGFAKAYLPGRELMCQALSQFKHEVESGLWPL